MNQYPNMFLSIFGMSNLGILSIIEEIKEINNLSIYFQSDMPAHEKATKFFYSIDLYNQKYVCYLTPSKGQLRYFKFQ